MGAQVEDVTEVAVFQLWHAVPFAGLGNQNLGHSSDGIEHLVVSGRQSRKIVTGTREHLLADRLETLRKIVAGDNIAAFPQHRFAIGVNQEKYLVQPVLPGEHHRFPDCALTKLTIAV